ncbi:MAG TPA: PDZ domain-containing protein [Gemmatimonadaceae bacterium]|jgi:S1-C subfamily serine protease|nr:PDZ domain-containing protein [Gemmatimonadaceae bacterium]
MTLHDDPIKRAAETRPRMSRRYIASLAGFAVVVLVVGVLVRRWLHDSETAAPAPPSQAAAFQLLSQEGQLQRTAAYVAQRVGAVARFVEYVPAVHASGVRWAADTVFTTDSVHIVRALVGTAAARAIDGDSSAHAVSVARDSVRRDWLLVVGRSPTGSVLSATVLSGGRAPVDCAGRTVESFVLGMPLDERLAGAGLFNVTGEALGMAVWCGARVLAIPAHEVARLARESGPAAPIASPFGLGVRDDSLAHAYLGGDSAVLVDHVRRGSAADRAGLRVGDALLAIAGAPAGSARARATLGPSLAESLVVTRRRGAAVARVTLSRSPLGASERETGFGIGVTQAAAPSGIEVTDVRRDSPAARAGLRAGDLLVRVGETPVTSPADADRLLAEASASRRPTLVVFERDDGEHGVLLGGAAAAEAAR